MSIHVLIAGMPNTGKSTFIAALKYLLTSGETSTELELTRLSSDEAHFNMLEEKWLDAESVDRTKPPTEKWVTFHIRDAQSGIDAEVVVPDLRGEHFEQPAAAGLCEPTLFRALADCDGLLLFTNADSTLDDLMITDVEDVIAAVEEASANDTPPGVTEVAPRPFKPDEMPEEAKLVELLQMMNRRPLGVRKRKLALIVSAWDVVSAQREVAPDAWLAEARPMLSQFLEFNPELWETRVYGVSAQGGPLPQDKERLKRVHHPSHRIIIVGPQVAEHDLSAPVRWLIGGR